MEIENYDKEFFQRSWGEQGYYEKFSYGVGIDKVCAVALIPFFNINKNALEIGSGGGVFTERMVGQFKHITAIDVIKKPEKFSHYPNFTYIELPNKSYDCADIENHSMDFCFSYNIFCHLSNAAISEYIENIYMVLREGGDFVFMLSNIDKIKQENKHLYGLGDCLPMGHYFQSDETLNLVINFQDWEVVSRNLIPEHRDIIVHLKK